MSQREGYKVLLRDPALRREYERESLYEAAISDILGLLNSRGLTQAELADRLGVSPGRVSQLLSGRRNLTLKSLADLTWALGMRVDLSLEVIEDLSATPAKDDAPLVPKWLSKRRMPVDWDLQDAWLPVATPVTESEAIAEVKSRSVSMQQFRANADESLVA